MYYMFKANAICDNISPALLAEKHLGFSVPTTHFIKIREAQHERYLDVIIDNKLNINYHIDEM